MHIKSFFTIKRTLGKQCENVDCHQNSKKEIQLLIPQG